MNVQNMTTKQSDDEDPVMPGLRGKQSTPLLSSFLVGCLGFMAYQPL